MLGGGGGKGCGGRRDEPGAGGEPGSSAGRVITGSRGAGAGVSSTGCSRTSGQGSAGQGRQCRVTLDDDQLVEGPKEEELGLTLSQARVCAEPEELLSDARVVGSENQLAALWSGVYRLMEKKSYSSMG